MSVFFIVAGLAALAYLPMAPQRPNLLRSFTKTLAVAALAVGAAGGPAWLVVALGACALGDWLLSRDGDAAFMAGVAAFAVGHLAYIVLFLTHPLADTSLLALPGRTALAAGLIVLGVVVAVVLFRKAGDLRVPVLGYVPVIIGMGLAALSLPRDGALMLVLPAALAFVLSDLILALETFVLPQGHAALRFTPYLVWPFYWAAQAGFYLAFV